MDDDVYIDFIDSHEEIEDIKRKLKFLECDSYERLLSMYVKHTVQPDIYSELNYSIKIANNLKHTIKSILLPYDRIPIPCINYIQSKIMYLILIFDYLRKNQMKYYMQSVMLRLKESVHSLYIATGISIGISDDYVVSSVNNYDGDDLAVMMMIVWKEAVKENQQEMMMIERCMEELVQVLFEMYVMVQKSCMNGGDELHEDIETLVRKTYELYLKRDNAEKRGRTIKFGLICVVLQLPTILFFYLLGIGEIGVAVAAMIIPLLVIFLMPPSTSTSNQRWKKW